MDILTLATGSTGNCFKISDSKTSLLIEAGIPIAKIKRGLNFKLSEVDGCLVSHGHKDHSLSAQKIVNMGIQVYCSRGAAEEVGLSSFYQLKSGVAVEIGTFMIVPFDTQHDAAEPLGFFIYSSETKKKLLFATDTFFIKHRFAGLTHLLIEVNYSEETLDPETPYIDRLKRSHFSLENVLKFLEANDLSQVEEIHLIHLSSRNGDGELFKNRIAAATGKYVVVAGE